MHHQRKQFKPPSSCHPLCWDKCSHKKIVPTSLPRTINKGNLEITSPATKAITNRREAVNNRILLKMPRQTNHPRTPHDQMQQDTMPHCVQTNHAHSMRSTGTTHSSVPSWVTLSRQLGMRFNMPPTKWTKSNPTRHHKDLLLWCSKTHYQSKDWWQPHPIPNPIPMLWGHLPL